MYVRGGCHHMIYGQTVLEMDYLDCSHQALSRIVVWTERFTGIMVNLNCNRISFSMICVQGHAQIMQCRIYVVSCNNTI